MSGFFQALQRRKVYRVVAAYIVVAGFLIQIASAAFPTWELPNWSLRLVIALLLIGFPIALILAWAYDVTPQGIEATARVPGAHRQRNLILLVVASAIISTAAGFFLLPRASARKIDKSIAVLPFASLSQDKSDAYFADGVQDQILTNLAKVKDIYDRALVLEGLVQVYTWSGDRDHAIELLQKLLTMPGYTNYGRLKLHPLWSPLRGDSRFEKIVAALAPKETAR